MDSKYIYKVNKQKNKVSSVKNIDKATKKINSSEYKKVKSFCSRTEGNVKYVFCEDTKKDILYYYQIGIEVFFVFLDKSEDYTWLAESIIKYHTQQAEDDRKAKR